MIVQMTLIIGLILFLFYLGYFLLMVVKSRQRDLLHNPRKEDFFPLVSVILATYNEENTVVRKLRNLMEQDYPNKQIIVVDGASEDGTVELIEEFVKDKDVEIKLIQERERRGKASALNEAFKHCSGKIVVITDADAICEKDALKKIVSNFSDANVGAATGRQVLLNPNQNLTTKFEKTYRGFFELLRVGECSLDATPVFNGPLMAFRLELLEEIPEDTIADDSHLAVQIREKGFRTVYDPDAVFYEYAPPTFRSRLSQKLRRGQGLVQMFLRQWRMLFNRKYGKFGMIVFPAEFFMHVVSPTMVLAFLVLSAYSLFLMGNYMLIGLIVVAGISFSALLVMKVRAANFILTFLDSQFILLLSLMCHIFGISQHKWTKVTEIRRLWKQNAVSE